MQTYVSKIFKERNCSERPCGMHIRAQCQDETQVKWSLNEVEHLNFVLTCLYIQ